MKSSPFLFRLVTALALAVVAAGTFVLWQQGRERAEGERLANEGEQALTAHDFARAATQFTAALEKPLSSETKAKVLTERGRARNELGSGDEAISDFTNAITLNPKIALAYRERGRAWLTKGEKTKALEDFGAAINRGADDAEIPLARGKLLLESNHAEEAVADFTEATKRAPDNLDAFLQLGRAQTARNNPDAAIASYDRALQIDPASQEAHAERGDLYSQKGDITKAMADYGELRTPKGEQAARSMGSNFAPGLAESVADLLRQATLKQANGELDDALALYNRILRMNIPLPTASVILQNRGNIYHRQGDDDRALQDYNQAIRFNPANPGAYANRGLIFAIRQDPQSATMDYNEALRFDPKMQEALYNRALTYLNEGDLERAERDLTATLALDDKLAAAYLVRSTILSRQNNLEKAMEDLNAAIANDPKMIEAYLGRAQLFSKKRAYARELQDLEKAEQLGPAGLVQALNGRAWLRATCPDKSVRNGKQAVADATRACELSTWGNGSLVDTLAAAYAENGDFAKAADFQMYALTLPGIPPEVRGEMEARVALYQKGRPYRETATK